MKHKQKTATGEYTPVLAKAVIRGLQRQRRADQLSEAMPVEQERCEDLDLFEFGKRRGDTTKFGDIRRGRLTPLTSALHQDPDLLDGHPKEEEHKLGR